MKILCAALVAPLLVIATPAESLVTIHHELTLTPSMIRNFSGQELRQTISFPAVTIRPNEAFEFQIDFAPGQSLSIIDDLSYPAVRSEIILLNILFADGIARNFNYYVDVLGTTGDFRGGFEATELRNRSTSPNLSNPSPFNLTDSSFSFSGVRWTGILAGTLTPLTLSSFTFETRADGLALNVAPPVPEPASWAMMIGGFAVVGGALRRRKSVHRAFGRRNRLAAGDLQPSSGV